MSAGWRWLLAAAALAGAMFLSTPRSDAQELDLSGTRKGPTYFFMTRAERAALSERVKNEPWAREFFEQKVLRRARRANPGDHVGNVANPMFYNAVAYIVTGEKRYAETARNQMMPYVVNWERYERDKPLKQCNYCWYLSPVDFPRTYDLVADTLGDEDEVRIRTYIKELLDKARAWEQTRYWNPNMTQSTFAYYGEWACAIGYDDYLDWLFNVPRPVCTWGGIWDNIDDNVRDGCISKETLGYGMVGACPLTLLADAMKRYRGEDILTHRTEHGATVKNMFDALIDFALPLGNWDREDDLLLVAGYGVSHGTGRVGQALAPFTWPSVAAYERVYRLTGDPVWGWVISLAGEKPDFDAGITRGATITGWSKFWDLLYGPVKLEKIGRPRAPSRFFPESGVAVLRADESSDYWANDTLTAIVKGCEQFRGEGSNWLMLFGAGRMLYPYDEGQQYSGIRYTKGINCIRIDGRDFDFANSESRHSFDPEVKFVDFRGAVYVEGMTERAVMLTKEYCLDVGLATVADRPINWPRPKDFGVYHARGRFGGDPYNASLSSDRIHVVGIRPVNMAPATMPASHKIDYALHAYGILQPEAWSLYEPSTELRKTGFGNRWIENERCCTTDGEIVVDWVQQSAGQRRRQDHRYEYWFERGTDGSRANAPDAWMNHRAGVRMRMLGEPGTIVFTGEKPHRPHGPVDRDLWPEEVLPFVTVRRQGKNALFVAVHEAYKPKEAGPQIESFEWIQKPSSDEKTPTVAVKVSAPDYTDRLFVTLGLQGERATQRVPWVRPEEKFLQGKTQVADLTKGWLIQKDPDKVGEKEGWQNPGFDRTGWKECDAGRDWFGALPDYYGDAWYARTFTVPAEVRSKKLYLWFESADKEAWVWVNGKKVGENHQWDIPFGIDITDVVKAEGENLVVAKVYSYAWGAGLLKPVSLLSEDGNYAAPTGVPAVPAPPAPTVTVTSAGDPRERITFRSHAYMRAAGDRLIVRGDIDSFSVLAPDAERVVVNGESVNVKRSGGYVLFAGAAPAEAPSVVIESVSAPTTIIYPGQSLPVKVVVRNASERKKKVRLTLRAKGARASKTRRMKLKPGEAQACHMTLSAPLTAPVGSRAAFRAQAAVGRQLARSSERILTIASPVAVRLPQKYVNVDEKEGGPMVVRLVNDSPSEVKGRVSLKPAAGLKYTQGGKAFSVPARSRTELALHLSPDGASVKLVPVDVVVEVAAGAQHYEAQKVRHDVAVGVVLTDYEQPMDRTAIYPVDTKSPWAPTGPRPELNFDSYLVRAPGYTIKIDKYSGVSRWIIDPDGKCRTELGWYQEALHRGRIDFREQIRDSMEFPCVRGKVNGKPTKAFAWDMKVELASRDEDEASGYPRLRFKPAGDRKDITGLVHGTLLALTGTTNCPTFSTLTPFITRSRGKACKWTWPSSIIPTVATAGR